MKLPQGLPLPQTTNTWASIIEPAINAQIIDGQLLTGIRLANGTTTINHGLGRKLVGWMIVGIDVAATVYDAQATNQMPQLTLVLLSNASALTNIWVF